MHNVVHAISMIASTRAVMLLPAYTKGRYLPESVTKSPGRRAKVPTLDLIIAYQEGEQLADPEAAAGECRQARGAGGLEAAVALFDHLVRHRAQPVRHRQPKALAVFMLITSSNLTGV